MRGQQRGKWDARENMRKRERAAHSEGMIERAIVGGSAHNHASDLPIFAIRHLLLCVGCTRETEKRERERENVMATPPRKPLNSLKILLLAPRFPLSLLG